MHGVDRGCGAWGGRQLIVGKGCVGCGVRVPNMRLDAVSAGFVFQRSLERRRGSRLTFSHPPTLAGGRVVEAAGVVVGRSVQFNAAATLPSCVSTSARAPFPCPLRFWPEALRLCAAWAVCASLLCASSSLCGLSSASARGGLRAHRDGRVAGACQSAGALNGRYHLSLLGGASTLACVFTLIHSSVQPAFALDWGCGAAGSG